MTEITTRRMALRRTLLAGVATGAAAFAANATAQTTPVVSQTEIGDIVYTAPLLEGGPAILELVSEQGAITADVTTIRSTNGATQADDTIVQLETNGTGGINGTFGTITATGTTGSAQALEADTDTADVTLKTGTIDLSGEYTRGIFAESNSGNVTITADQTYARGSTLRDDDGAAGDAITGLAGGTVSITSNIAEATGLYASALIGIGDAGTTIASTRATSSSDQTITVYGASDTGTTSITSGAIENRAAIGGLGLNAVSTSGGVTVKSGTILTTGTNAAAISAVANAGTVDVTSEKISNTGTGATGISARGQTISVTSGEVVTGRGAIVAQGQGANSSTTIKTTGTTAVATGTAIVGTGATVAITTGGETRSANGQGISANGGLLSITTGADTLTTGTIAAIAANGQSVTIANGGTAAGTGPAQFGINAVSNAATGKLDITSKAVTLEGAGSGNGALSAGIYAVANNAAPLTIDSGSVMTGGTDAYGIYAQTTGALSVKSGSLSTSSVNRAGLRASGGTGAVTVVSDTIDLAAVTSGIFASSGTGNISVSSNRVTQAGLSPAQTMLANYGIFATSSSGTVTIDSKAVTTSGYLTHGINATSGNSIAITSGTVTTNDFAAGILATARAGDVTIGSDTVTLNGAGALGINATATLGRADVTSKAVAGGDVGGIIARGAAGASITSGSVQVDRGALVAQSANGDVSVTTTGDTRSTKGVGISANGGTVTVSTAADTIVSGGTLGIDVAARGGASVTNRGTVAATGTGDSAIRVTAPGAIAITSNAVTIEGAAEPSNYPAAGILATGGAGAITIASTSAIVGGQGRDGIRATGTGTIDVTSGTVAVASDHYAGIVANGGGEAVTVRSGRITGTGLSQSGISAYAATGPVSIVSDTVEMSGLSGIGITASGSGALTIDAVRTVSTAAGIDEDSGQSAEAITANSSAGPITIRSGEASTAGLYASAISAASGTSRTAGGDISITSGTASSTGDQNATIYGYSRGGNVSITADKVTTSGSDVLGIYANATTGRAAVDAKSVTGTGAGALGIQAIGDAGASVTAGDVATVSDAVFIRSRLAEARALLTGSVASSEGSAVVAAGPQVAIEVAATGKLSGVTGITASHGTTAAAVTDAITITNAGSVTGTDTGVLLAGGTLTNSGTITGGTHGIRSTADASIDNTGTLAGTLLADARLELVNSGTIRGSGTGPAIVATGPAALINSGTIAGTGGIAVQLGAGDDYVELRDGSAIDGYLLSGGGNDVLNLVGTSATQTSTQRVAASDGFALINVDSGYWTADTGPSQAGYVTINQGATLRYNEVTLGGQSYSPIYSYAINNDGRLVVDFRSTGTIGNLEGIAVGGTGAVDFVGTGQFIADSDALTYTGPTSVSNGTVVLAGNLPGALTINAGGTVKLVSGDDYGTLGGTLGGAVLNNGTFVYDRTDSYTIADAFDGTGSLVKNGAGTLTFGGSYAFNGTTTINAGAIRLAGAIDPTSSVNVQSGTVDLSAANAPVIAALAGSAGGNVEIGSNTLTINQAGATSYAGTLSGSGAIVKTGEGRLDLTGVNPFTGTTTVSGGTLAVNGSLSGSALTVASGGTLGGNGTVGATTIQQGGTFAPGNSIGTTHVNGDVTFAAGSIYQVEANAAGQSDQVVATGRATLSGGTVQVLADGSTRYRGRTGYTILTANGGVAGTFAGVTSNLAFLTPTLGYTANGVSLTLTRNNVDFVTVGTTPNQRAVGAAVQALGAGNALFEEALFLSDTGAGTSFDQLSGEYHADVSTTLIADTQPVRQALLLQPNGGEGMRAWGFAVGSRLSSDSAASGVKAQRGLIGGLAGLGYATGGLDIGLGGGYGHSDVNVLGLGSSGGIDTTYVAAYAGYRSRGFALRIGGTHAWHDVDGQRAAQIGAVGGIARSKYDAKTWQLFGEVGYGLTADAVAIEPFAGIAHVRSTIDAFAESGPVTALAVAADKRQATFSTLGLRASGAVANADGLVFSPRASGAWRHGWGDLGSLRGVQLTGAPAFAISGTALPKDVADVTVGLDIDSGPARLSLGYVGSIGKDWHDHGLQANVTLRF